MPATTSSSGRGVGRDGAARRVTPSGEMRTRRRDTIAAATASAGTPSPTAAAQGSERWRSDG
jgi:hypothetical protein